LPQLDRSEILKARPITSNAGQSYRLRALDISASDIADLLEHSRGNINAHYSRVSIERLMACVDKKPELVLIRKTA